MDAKKKLEWRSDSELIAVYGFPPDFNLTPEAKFGLWLNRSRANAIRSAQVMRGINASFQPDPSIADALAELPEQVDELMRTWKANVEESRAMNRG